MRWLLREGRRKDKNLTDNIITVADSEEDGKNKKDSTVDNHINVTDIETTSNMSSMKNADQHKEEESVDVKNSSISSLFPNLRILSDLDSDDSSDSCKDEGRLRDLSATRAERGERWRRKIFQSVLS